MAHARISRLPNAIPALLVQDDTTLFPERHPEGEDNSGDRILALVGENGKRVRFWEQEWVDPTFFVAERALASLPTGKRANNNHARPITIGRQTFDSSVENPGGQITPVIEFPQNPTK